MRTQINTNSTGFRYDKTSIEHLPQSKLFGHISAESISSPKNASASVTAATLGGFTKKGITSFRHLPESNNYIHPSATAAAVAGKTKKTQLNIYSMKNLQLKQPLVEHRLSAHDLHEQQRTNFHSPQLRSSLKATTSLAEALAPIDLKQIPKLTSSPSKPAKQQQFIHSMRSQLQHPPTAGSSAKGGGKGIDCD